jgi:triosephosphate isomerase
MLSALQLQGLESGASTGRQVLNAGGALLESRSPVDGALIGGASLDPEELAKITKFYAVS